jgi:hypothetical protein
MVFLQDKAHVIDCHTGQQSILDFSDPLMQVSYCAVYDHKLAKAPNSTYMICVVARMEMVRILIIIASLCKAKGFELRSPCVTPSRMSALVGPNEDQSNRTTSSSVRRVFLITTATLGTGVLPYSAHAADNRKDTMMTAQGPKNKRIGGLVSKIRAIGNTMVCQQALLDLAHP